MSAWAKPGVKCVCINDGDWVEGIDGPIYENEFAPDQVLTVVEVGIDDLTGEVVISLWGTPLGEAYVARWFRPLTPISQEQDVAKFRHLLVPSPTDAGLVPAGVEMDT
jgi:hypothetical protein